MTESSSFRAGNMPEGWSMPGHDVYRTPSTPADTGQLPDTSYPRPGDTDGSIPQLYKVDGNAPRQGDTTPRRIIPPPGAMTGGVYDGGGEGGRGIVGGADRSSVPGGVTERGGRDAEKTVESGKLPAGGLGDRVSAVGEKMIVGGGEGQEEATDIEKLRMITGKYDAMQKTIFELSTKYYEATKPARGTDNGTGQKTEAGQPDETPKPDDATALLEAAQQQQHDACALASDNLGLAQRVFSGVRREIIGNTDWPRLIEHACEPTNGTHLQGLFTALARDIDPQDSTVTTGRTDDTGDNDREYKFNMATMRLETLESYHDLLARHRLPDTESIQTNTDETRHDTDLTQNINGWIHALTDVARGLGDPQGRSKVIASAIPAQQLATLSVLDETIGSAPGCGAIRQGMRTVFDTLSERVHCADNQFLESKRQQTDGNIPTISGQEHLTATIGITDIDQWLASQLNEWPPEVAAAIKEIRIVPHGDPGLNADTTVGQWHTPTGILTLSASDDRPDRLRTMGICEKDIRQIISEDTRGTIAHELMHVYTDIVPLGWLMQWQEAAAGEPVDVSPYAGQKADGNPFNKEDLAETGRMYRYSPVTLACTAPERFGRIHELLRAYSDQAAATASAVAVELDGSEPNVRTAMLKILDDVMSGRWQPRREPPTSGQPARSSA